MAAVHNSQLHACIILRELSQTILGTTHACGCRQRHGIRGAGLHIDSRFKSTIHAILCVFGSCIIHCISPQTGHIKTITLKPRQRGQGIVQEQDSTNA